MRVEIEWQSALQPCARPFQDLPSPLQAAGPCINATLRAVFWRYGHCQQAVRRYSPHRVTEGRPISRAEEYTAIDLLAAVDSPMAILETLPPAVPVLLLNSNDWSWDEVAPYGGPLPPGASADDLQPVQCQLQLSLPQGPVAQALLDRLKQGASSGVLSYDELEIAIAQLSRESEVLYLQRGLVTLEHGSPATAAALGSGTHPAAAPVGSQ